MAIDPLHENLMPLTQLRRHLPGKPAYMTLFGWCKAGRVNRLTGKRVFLEQIRLPSGMHSSLEAYLRFLESLNRLD